jgi:hypothetical protein
MPTKVPSWDDIQHAGLYGVKDLMKVLGVCRKTVYRWLKAGDLVPVENVGGKEHCFTFDEVRRFVTKYYPEKKAKEVRGWMHQRYMAAIEEHSVQTELVSALEGTRFLSRSGSEHPREKRVVPPEPMRRPPSRQAPLEKPPDDDSLILGAESPLFDFLSRQYKRKGWRIESLEEEIRHLRKEEKASGKSLTAPNPEMIRLCSEREKTVSERDEILRQAKEERQRIEAQLKAKGPEASPVPLRPVAPPAPPRRGKGSEGKSEGE